MGNDNGLRRMYVVGACREHIYPLDVGAAFIVEANEITTYTGTVYRKKHRSKEYK